LKLEELAKVKRHEMGFAPWSDWTSERTGFGKLFRKRAKYPSFLSLKISSDHYVDAHTGIRDDERSPRHDIYLSWNRDKVDRLSAVGSARYIHCQHPWLKSPGRFAALKSGGDGTLFFWPHSRPGVRVHVDPREVADSLRRLPNWYQPVSLMLSSHDIDERLHKDLAPLGFPMYTAGSLLNQNFPQYFYALLSRFAFTASLNPSSHAFYSLDVGKPHRLLEFGEIDFEYHLGDGSVTRRNWYESNYFDSPNLEDIRDRHLDLLLPHRTVSRGQQNWVRSLLGEDAALSDSEFARLVWGSLISGT